jgi:hypothetical protein
LKGLAIGGACIGTGISGSLNPVFNGIESRDLRRLPIAQMPDMPFGARSHFRVAALRTSCAPLLALPAIFAISALIVFLCVLFSSAVE